MADKIQIRRDTASNWTTANTTLAQGEFGYELDTGKIKVGDGSTVWTSLPYSFEGVTDHGLLSGLSDNDHPQYALISNLNPVATSGDHSDLTLDDGTNPHGTTKSDVGLSNVPNTDATQRSNHTGTQTASTISDFTAEVKQAETNTTLTNIGNTLRYTNEDGIQYDIDLSVYLDDSNLARITTGTLNSSTGIATFTRDDNSTFTVDFSSLNDQSAINAAISTHESASDPHTQYLQLSDLPTNHAVVDADNNFSESQSIKKTTGIASLDIDSDDNSALTIYRAGSNLWSTGVDDFSGSDEFRITSTNGMTGSVEFVVKKTVIDAKSKRINNVSNPVVNEDAANKIYVDNGDSALQSQITTNTSDINTLDNEQAVQDAAIALNTAKEPGKWTDGPGSGEIQHLAGPVAIGGNAASEAIFQIKDEQGKDMFFDQYGTSGSAYFAMRKARGTIANPTALQNNDKILGYGAFSHDGTGFQYVGETQYFATQNHSPTARGSKIQWTNTRNNQTTPTLRMLLEQDGSLSLLDTICNQPQHVPTKAYTDIVSGRRFYQATNTQTSQNLNTGTNFSNNVQIFGAFIDESSGDFTLISNTTLRANFSGWIEVSFDVFIESFSQRASPHFRLKINGTPTGPVAASTYIRSSSGHNESSGHISCYRVAVSTNDTIILGSEAEGSGGTTTFSSTGTSRILVKRVG